MKILLTSDAELATAILLVVKTKFLEKLVATLVKTALAPVLGPEFRIVDS